MRRGFGTVRIVPWRRGWQVRVVRGSENKHAFLIERPLLRMIVLEQPMRFTTLIDPEEAQKLAARIGEWIDGSPA